MITISLCMIVKNEEDVLGRCLDSIADLVDEIVIVDTGSSDRTKEIARRYTDKILDFVWIDDFAAARNASFAAATMDYLLWLDADDILLEKDRDALKKLKVNLTDEHDVITFVYNYYSDGEGKPLLQFKRERLVKREKHFQWKGFIHEYIETSGDVWDADVVITHARVHDMSDRNLNAYQKKLAEGVEFSVRDQYYYANELFYHGLWEQAVPVYEKFLTQYAWIEDKIDACCKLSECYHQLNQPQKGRRVLLSSLEYTTPRAEVLYRLANSFEQEGRLDEAIYWYEAILTNLKMPEGAGFISPEYWTWRPHLQLCVCYYKKGNLEKAIEHHRASYEMNQNDPAILANQRFFEQL